MIRPSGYNPQFRPIPIFWVGIKIVYSPFHTCLSKIYYCDRPSDGIVQIHITKIIQNL